MDAMRSVSVPAGVIAWAASALVGCGGGATVRIVDVPDDTYLRGVQLSKLETEELSGVVRAELYLDGSRVAADEFAPFELAWDTRSFDDGRHTLAARVYVTSGDPIEGTASIWIDNTAPVLGAVPATAVGGTAFAIEASDNFRVASLVVTRDVPGEDPVALTAPPFKFIWKWGCGPSTLYIRVVDAAGGEATAMANVTAVDAADRDCDGFRGTAMGGLDCDDGNPAAHPGAHEPPEGFDLNCDGQIVSLAGVDADADGVLSIKDGGSDCDDTDPAIHGNAYAFEHVALQVDDAPVRWNPGEAALEANISFWTLAVIRDGALMLYRAGFGGEVVAEPLATGVNASSLSLKSGWIAFGRGNDVVVLEPRSDGWGERDVIHTGGPVGRLLVDRNPERTFAVFQIGTSVLFASPDTTLRWSIELIDDLHEPLVQNPVGYALTSYYEFVLQTPTGVWRYSRLAGDSVKKTRIGPADQVPVAATVGLGTSLSVVAVDDGPGSAIYFAEQPQRMLQTTKRVKAMAARYPSVFVQLEDNTVEVYALTKRTSLLRHAQTITDAGAFDISDYGGFAGNGMLHRITLGSVFAPRDLPDDRVDSDCDERD